MLVECSNCAAPLDVKTGARFAKCAYCRKKNIIQQTRTIQQVTPPQWRPPPMWTPPPQAHAPHVPMKYRRRSRSSPIASIIMLLLVAAGFGGYFAIVQPRGGFKMLLWDKKSTVTCETNGSLTIRDIKANVKRGPVVDMGMNCKLKIINSTLRGRTGIKTTVNNEIEITDSVIDVEKIAIDGQTNTKIIIDGSSKIKSEGVGIALGSNGRLTLEDSEIKAEREAVELGRNGRLDCTNGKLEGNPSVGKPSVGRTKMTMVNCQ